MELTRRAFPLSRRREDTFIAGLSMGGYGAIRNGLKYHDTFGCIAGLSSAMIVDGLEARTNDTPNLIERKDFAERIFGDLARAKDSDMNPKWLVEKAPGTAGGDSQDVSGLRHGGFSTPSKSRDAGLLKGRWRGCDLRGGAGRT